MLGPEFSICTAVVDGESRVMLRGEIDLLVRVELAEALDAVAAISQRVVVDMTEVSFMDSTGIGVLARVVRDGASVVVMNPQLAVRRALEVSGIDKVLQISVDRPEPDR